MRATVKSYEGYPCPECGYDGPHSLIGVEPDGVKLIECGAADCAREFEVRELT